MKNDPSIGGTVGSGGGCGHSGGDGVGGGGGGGSERNNHIFLFPDEALNGVINKAYWLDFQDENA